MATELQPLDFEKPIVELQRRLQDLKEHSREHDVDLDSEIERIESKLRDTRRDIYGNLSAWQRVQIARHVHRPFALDYVERCFTGWTELHGDRRFADDKAMPSGLAMVDSTRCVVITHQKGRNTKENVMRNFGCAHPEGYRKALRLMLLAQKFNMPVISLIDTPGAFPGIGSEERHISEAIAVNLREMMTLRIPIIAGREIPGMATIAEANNFDDFEVERTRHVEVPAISLDKYAADRLRVAKMTVGTQNTGRGALVPQAIPHLGDRSVVMPADDGQLIILDPHLEAFLVHARQLDLEHVTIAGFHQRR